MTIKNSNDQYENSEKPAGLGEQIFNSNKNCVIANTAKLVGDIWTLLIIKELRENKKRFCELQDQLSAPGKTSIISSKTLTNRLKVLEQEDIINRQVINGSPVKVEYNLTKKGHDLSKVIKVLNEFGLKYN